MPDTSLCGTTTITQGPHGEEAHRCGLLNDHETHRDRKQHVCFVCGHPWTT